MSDVRTKRNLVMSIPVIALLLVGPVLRAGAAPCGHTACKDEVALSGLTDGARSGCFARNAARSGGEPVSQAAR